MADPQVGELFPMNEAFPKPLQPGGRLTPVTMPAQDVSAKTGKWVFFCGHSSNTPMVVRYGKEDGTQGAALCCPLCMGIEKLYASVDDAYSEIEMALLS